MRYNFVFPPESMNPTDSFLSLRDSELIALPASERTDNVLKEHLNVLLI